MTQAKKKAQEMVIEIAEVKRETIDLYVVGTSPFIFNRMSEKVKRILLLPTVKTKGKPKRTAEPKHIPMEEFLASFYRMDPREEEVPPTYFGFPASAFKGAMRTAALDLPGSSKAQIGRLVYVRGFYPDMVCMWGLPQIMMAIVRQAGIDRTPDVRTRCVLPRWAAKMTVSFASPLLKAPAVLNLLSAGGVTCGVGDWRTEKGKGDYGQFRIANENDPELQEMLAGGGREAQIKALESPVFYDQETEDLFTWCMDEIERRGFKYVSSYI